MSPPNVAGKYELGSALGEGAMGVVYEATNLVTGRRVALKLLRADAGGGAGAGERLFREARAAGQIESRHIAQVLDAGAEEGNGFLVLELLRGADLQGVIGNVGPLETSLALRLVGQACLGLAKAHAAGVLHRDIKPANLFVAHEEGELVVKLLDFGLAKALAPEALGGVGRRSLTSDRVVVGTPLYMSPEQARSAKTIDARSDVWSLGVVLYEALTGRAPHETKESFGEIILAICGTRVRLAADAPDVPPEVAAIVDRALDLDPSHRFQSAEAMLVAIRALVGGSLAIDPAELPVVMSRRAPSTTRPSDDGETIEANAPPTSSRVRTLTLASSQVVIEVAPREGYLLADVRGRMSSTEDAHTSNLFLMDSLADAGLRTLLIDARRADGTKHGHNGLWDWIRAGAGFERLAVLVESSALRRGFDAQAIEEGANARAFEDLAEAEAWLRGQALLP